MSFARALVLLLFRRDQQAEIVGGAFIRFGETRGAFGDGAVGKKFAGADAHEIVAEPGAQTGGNHAVEMLEADEAVHTKEKFTSFTSILIGKEIFRAVAGVTDRGDSGASHGFGDALDAFAAMFAGGGIGLVFLQESVGGVGSAARQFVSGRVAIELAASRIGSLLIDACEAESGGVVEGSMSAAMLHGGRMVGNSRVEIRAREHAAFGTLGVVVLGAVNPLTRGRFRGALAECGLNGGDGGEIAIHRDDHVEARGGGMAVRVVEAGENGFADEVEFLGCCVGEMEYVVVPADGE